jgi:hypothetical protein
MNINVTSFSDGIGVLFGAKIIIFRVDAIGGRTLFLAEN